MVVADVLVFLPVMIHGNGFEMGCRCFPVRKVIEYQLLISCDVET